MSRLPRGAVALLAVPLLLGLAPGADPRQAAEWPVFRGNPLQTGVAASGLPKDLDVVWTFRAKDSIESAPAVVGGTVYVGSEDRFLYALDLATGKLKWKFEGGPFKAAAAVKGGSVYVGDEDGQFWCVDAAAGKKRWVFKTQAEISSGANFSGDDVLFGSGDEHLYCLSKDGKERWRFKLPGGPVMASPTVADGRTFVAGCDSTLHVIYVARGKEVETVEVGGQVAASAGVIGNELYVGTMTNQVLGIDWKKGKVLWTFEPPNRKQPFYASVAVTDKLVIAGGRDKRVWALDRKSGKAVWNFPTNGRIEGSPVVVGNRVFAGSMDGNLYVLDLAKGTLLKKHELDGPIAGSPAVAGGRLVIGTTKGTVYCFGAKE